METMAKHEQVHATFVEKKYIKGVNEPVESSGKLGFIAPTTIIKNTLQPIPEIFKLTNNFMIVKRKGRTRSFQIHDFPELGAHFEGIRALLAGDADGMKRLYKVNLTGTSTNWKLVLHPMQTDTALKMLNLIGSQNNVESVEIHLEDGDYSIMQLSGMDTNQ